VTKIKKFILGLVIGVFLSFGLYFMRSSDTRLHVDVGRFLDQDIVYLKDGGLIRGWVVDEGGNEILIETGKGTFTLPRSICRRVEKKVFLRFVRKAI